MRLLMFLDFSQHGLACKYEKFSKYQNLIGQI